jgi:cell division protein FtsI (penicillin-binding protein 3)
MDAATIPFGQGISVTTLQLAVAMAALGNHGRLMHPTLLRRVEDARGEVVQETLPRAGKEVVPAQVAALLTDMLVGVTGDGGTGKEAAIDGLLVAGKTGTAQKADYVHGGYAEDKWLSSFIGFAPAHKPRLVVAVAIDEPLIAHQGGTVAAPAFRRIMEASLRHLGVVPTAPADAPLARKTSPTLPGPAAPSQPSSASATSAEQPAGPEQRRVPDFLGKSARNALVAASQAGLLLTLAGSGVVVGQKPSAGETVQVGMTVEVTLASPQPESGPAVPGMAEQQGKTPATGTHAQAPLTRPVAEGRDG